MGDQDHPEGQVPERNLLTLMPSADELTRHPVTGRFLAFDCEIDCPEHCAGLCGNWA